MIWTIVLAAALQSPCPIPLVGEAGGDYTNPEHRQRLATVEGFHFTPQVEKLQRGASDKIGGDISYTLDHFPNHYRALSAMAKLGLREKAGKPEGAHFSVDCYFQRALMFKSGDAAVHTIYGAYLMAREQADDALTQLMEAARIDPANATTHYNLGLLYFKKKDYQQARGQAQEAYRLGFPMQGLKNKLIEVKQWDSD